jgi:prepilin-type N-terminal cleavage/methylation domain-containing protein
MNRGVEKSRGRARRRAFTLIELLTVIAIIGILAAILIPTASAARTAANKAKTRAQFSQWATAFEAFRQEYGAYPQLHSAGDRKLVNEGSSTNPRDEHLFHDLLAGQRRDPSAGNWLSSRPPRNPPAPENQNSRRIRFVSFSESDFVTEADIAAGRNPSVELYFLRDAFHNTSIAVITDSNHDGVINGRDATGGFPAVSPADGGASIRPTTIIPSGNSGGIHAGVIFYSAPPGAKTEHDLVVSTR